MAFASLSYHSSARVSGPAAGALVVGAFLQTGISHSSAVALRTSVCTTVTRVTDPVYAYVSSPAAAGSLIDLDFEEAPRGAGGAASGDTLTNGEVWGELGSWVGVASVKGVWRGEAMAPAGTVTDARTASCKSEGKPVASVSY